MVLEDPTLKLLDSRDVHSSHLKKRRLSRKEQKLCKRLKKQSGPNHSNTHENSASINPMNTNTTTITTEQTNTTTLLSNSQSTLYLSPSTHKNIPNKIFHADRTLIQTITLKSRESNNTQDKCPSSGRPPLNNSATHINSAHTDVFEKFEATNLTTNFAATHTNDATDTELLGKVKRKVECTKSDVLDKQIATKMKKKRKKKKYSEAIDEGSRIINSITGTNYHDDFNLLDSKISDNSLHTNHKNGETSTKILGSSDINVLPLVPISRVRMGPTIHDYKDTYVPTQVPIKEKTGVTCGVKVDRGSSQREKHSIKKKNDNENTNDQGGNDWDNSPTSAESLGKWFPKAVIVKSCVHYDNSTRSINSNSQSKGHKKGKNVQGNAYHNADDSSDDWTVKPTSSLLLFYQYVSPLWTSAKVDRFIEYLVAVIKNRPNVGGRIRIAREGLNCTISAADVFEILADTNDGPNDSPSNIPSNGPNDSYNHGDSNRGYHGTKSFRSMSAAETLRHFTYDLQHFDSSSFVNTDFKFLDNLRSDRHFKDIKILPVQELVYYGGVNETTAPIEKTGIHLQPHEFRNMLLYGTTSTSVHESGENNPNDNAVVNPAVTSATFAVPVKSSPKGTVVIDVRNHYEAAIGRFDGQMFAASPSLQKQQHKQKKQQQQPMMNRLEDDDACNHENNFMAKVKCQTSYIDKNNNKSSEQPIINPSDFDETSEIGVDASLQPAIYVDPKMRKSTDFTSWLTKDETKELLKDKNVLLYCTGGVRCERASAYLNLTYGQNNHVAGIYQLQGGIEKFLQTFPDGGTCWRGKNFVFDKREAVSAHNPNGDGGVLTVKPPTNNTISTRTENVSPSTSATPFSIVPTHKPVIKKDKHVTSMNKGCDGPSKTTAHPNATASIVVSCCICSEPWDRYVGKKKCSTCGVPVLVCDTCMTKKLDISRPLKRRCPLCVEENVTVLVNEVEYTNNGIGTVNSSTTTTSTSTTATAATKKIKPSSIGITKMSTPGIHPSTKSCTGAYPDTIVSTSQSLTNGTNTDAACTSIDGRHEKRITAPTVLKWGGGHANEKKFRRMVSRKFCKYGADCNRSDCFFFHPTTELPKC